MTRSSPTSVPLSHMTPEKATIIFSSGLLSACWSRKGTVTMDRSTGSFRMASEIRVASALGGR